MTKDHEINLGRVNGEYALHERVTVLTQAQELPYGDTLLDVLGVHNTPASLSRKEVLDEETAQQRILRGEVIGGDLGPVIGFFGLADNDAAVNTVNKFKDRKAPLALMMDPIDVMSIIDIGKLDPAFQAFFIENGMQEVLLEIQRNPEKYKEKGAKQNLFKEKNIKFEEMAKRFREFVKRFTGIHLRFIVRKDAQIDGKPIPECALTKDEQGNPVVQVIFLNALNPLMSRIVRAARKAGHPYVFGTSANVHENPENFDHAQIIELQQRHRDLLANGAYKEIAEVQREIYFYNLYNYKGDPKEGLYGAYRGSYPTVSPNDPNHVLIRQGNTAPALVNEIVGVKLNQDQKTKKSNHGFVEVDPLNAAFIANMIAPADRLLALEIYKALQIEMQEHDNMVNEIHAILQMLYIQGADDEEKKAYFAKRHEDRMKKQEEDKRKQGHMEMLVPAAA